MLPGDTHHYEGTCMHMSMRLSAPRDPASVSCRSRDITSPCNVVGASMSLKTTRRDFQYAQALEIEPMNKDGLLF